MNYSNPFINPYGYGQQVPGQFAQPAMPPQPALQQVVRVNGENGARAYQIGPNSSAMLLDESGTLVWLVTSDGAGYKTVAAYDITPHQEAPAPDYTDLETRVKKLEEMMNGGKRNGNSGNTATVGKKSNEPGGGTD